MLRGIGPLELILILILMLLAATYFVPCIIAFIRKHQHAVPILIINIFLGWTFFAWVVCLVWSLMPVRREYEN